MRIGMLLLRLKCHSPPGYCRLRLAKRRSFRQRRPGHAGHNDRGKQQSECGDRVHLATSSVVWSFSGGRTVVITFTLVPGVPVNFPRRLVRIFGDTTGSVNRRTPSSSRCGGPVLRGGIRGRPSTQSLLASSSSQAVTFTGAFRSETGAMPFAEVSVVT